MRIRGVGASRSVEASPSCLPPFLIGEGPCLAVVFRQAGGRGLRIREVMSPGLIVAPLKQVVISRLPSCVSPPLIIHLPLEGEFHLGAGVLHLDVAPDYGDVHVFER